ncbi:hypothetical protein QUC31_017374 [Theobroma cacao]|uniref:Uncharacterized protein LOC108660453 n=1 Tax=Theobroma cacao TaxID=3641 RepID=A0AB32WA94_THECC|nr:PREDICTED: uncharacterized protein LOC108660453 [Theobroma cacao]
MKRAKVSSVYEGRGRKRGIEGEEEGEDSSKSARMSAKARTNGLRARKALSIISNNRTIITRSMSTKTVEENGEEKVVEVDGEEKNMNDDNKALEEQQPVNEVVEKKGDDDGGLTLEDWPLTWSFEEELTWFKAGHQCGWYSYWETMNGDFWKPKDDNQEDFWNDEPWNFDGKNEIPKP